MTQNLPAEIAPEAVTLFRTDDPAEIVARATHVANHLADVIRKQKLTVRIQNRDHVRVEGWTLLGTMLGVFPVLAWTRAMDNGWEARVEARTRDGQIVGAAEAECLRSEQTWAKRDDYALRSMAQTRATSKAMRQPLGFVMTLAGFDATPAEEMPRNLPEALQPPEDDDPERMTLTGTLVDLAIQLDKRDETIAFIRTNREFETPAGHKRWLQKQIEAAIARLEKQQTQGFHIPDSVETA